MLAHLGLGGGNDRAQLPGEVSGGGVDVRPATPREAEQLTLGAQKGRPGGCATYVQTQNQGHTLTHRHLYRRSDAVTPMRQSMPPLVVSVYGGTSFPGQGPI